MRFGIYIGLRARRQSSVPAPPPGNVILIDEDGALLLDHDGAQLIAPEE